MSETGPVLYGKYQLLELLARGGMAEVFKAKAHGVEGFEKILVIKRILPELSENPRFVEMFINEAKIAVGLSHANIVQVFDLGVADGSYFIAMEYVAGMDLATLLKASAKLERTMPSDLAAYVVSELAKGLDYAHRRRDAEMRPMNLVHRDVSPQNILASHEGEVKLTDFGIAKARTQAQAATEMGVVKGKYAYMAPEQVSGGKLDARSDVFAAGVLLYEILTGVNPHRGASAYETLARVRSGDVQPIRELMPDIPEELERVVTTAMARNPEDRFQSAGHLYEALIQYLYGSGRRVSARDLADYMASVRGEPARSSRPQPEIRLEEVFEAESLTGMERIERENGPQGSSDNTRVTRGRPRRESSVKAIPLASREKAEWRDVTLLSARCDTDDPLTNSTITRFLEGFGGTILREGAPENDVRLVQGLFGVTAPDGRDTETAARCALRLSQAGSAVAAEIGASTTMTVSVYAGRVLVDFKGELQRDEHCEGLQGLGEQLAKDTEVGQVLVDEEAARFLVGRFRVINSQHEGMTFHVLASERRVADTHGRFVGRRNELKVVGELLGRANKGRRSLIGLCGEAGSGKSRLLAETTRRLSMAGHDVGLHVATLTARTQEVPLAALREMLRTVLGLDEFDPEPLQRDRATRLRELGLLSMERAAVAAALGLATEGRKRSSKRPLKAALLRMIRRLAEDRLTIFAWDGAEYMDRESSDIIDELVRAVPEARVAIILSYRPGFTPRWVDLPDFTEACLGPMVDDEVARLMATRLGSEELPIDLLRDVTTKSGGNPLYVEEYIKALSEAGAVVFDEGQVRYQPKHAGLEVPKTLRGIVSARIAALRADARYLLQVACVAGTRFSTNVVARAAEEDPVGAVTILSSVDMQGIVTRRSPSEFAFAHDLVRQVLFEALTVQARREIHAAIAVALETLHAHHLEELAERLADHWREAGELGYAAEHWVRAADRLEAAYSAEAAINALSKAIETIEQMPNPDPDRRFGLYERIGALSYRNRALQKGAERMEKAFGLAEALKLDRYTARFAMWRGKLLVSASRIDEGRRWLDQARHIARAITDPELSREIFIAMAEAEARSGQYTEAVGSLTEALRLAEETKDPEATVRSLMPLALIYARMGEHLMAVSTLTRVREYSASFDAMTETHVHELESKIHYHARDQRAALAAATKAMEVAKEAGFHYESAINEHQIADCYLRLGEHKRAFAALRSSYEIASEHSFTKLQMANMRLLGFIDATRFGSAEGRVRMLDAIKYAESNGYVWDVIEGKYMLAIVDQTQGDADAASRTLREVLELAVHHGHRRYIEDTEQAQRQLSQGQSITLPV